MNLLKIVQACQPQTSSVSLSNKLVIGLAICCKVIGVRLINMRFSEQI